LGRQVHFHDGVWWVKSAPFYYKPVHEFRPFPPKHAKPNPVKAMLGYSHQVPNSTQAKRFLRWNILNSDKLKIFTLDRLKSAKRRAIRKGLKECHVEQFKPSDNNLERMRLINISQARRFKKIGEVDTYLPEDYYNLNAAHWREDMIKQFSHQAHQFIGAFVNEQLVAYIDLIVIEDTWLFGAVKSCDDYLDHRPVDALYFNIINRASQCGKCSRVVNGGGYEERVSLTRFKEEYLLEPTDLPYYSITFLSMNKLMKLKSALLIWRRGRNKIDFGRREKKV